MKDAQGKILTREHYELLRDLGIEIVMYDLKTHNGLQDPAAGRLSYGFEVHGSFTANVDFGTLLEFLKLLKTAKESDNPAIKDAFDHLKIVIGISDEH